MRRCAYFLASHLSVGVSVLTSRVGCGGDAVAAPKGVASTAMGRGALRVPWRCASTSCNGSSGSSRSGGGGIRESSEYSAELWTMQSRVRDVLLCEVDAIGGDEFWKFVKDKCKLSLTKAEKEEFIEHPEHYIDDEKLCNRIVSLPSYTLLKAKFKKAMELQKTADHLESLGIIYLHQWKEYAKKDTLLISAHAKGLLNRALTGVAQLLPQGQLFEHLLAPNATVLDGLYDSVCNASCSFVVKSPHGAPDRFWLEVRKEPHSLREWTNEEVDYLTHSVDSATAARIRNAREKELMEDEDNVQPTQGCVVMKVLTSPKGWPYGLYRHSSIFDCFVTKEVERVWRVVRGDLRDWFEAEPRVIRRSRQRVLIGSPGIGKSMAVGSYLLHQLLQYDAKILPVVAYFFSDETYIFNKTTKQVAVYDNVMGLFMVEQLAHNYNGYTIYDCSKESDEPPLRLPGSWGTVVISTPDENNFKGWEKQKVARRFIINCPEESDIKAMCIWKKRGQPDDLREYWKEVKNRMSNVGPILRFIFSDDKSYNDHCEAVDEALGEINSETVGQYYNLGVGGFWRSDKVSHRIVKIIREMHEYGVETFFNEPVCPKAKKRIQNAVSDALRTNAAFMPSWLPLNELIRIVLETLGVKAFKEKIFVEMIHDKLTEFRPKESKRPGKPWVLYKNLAACPDDWIPVPRKSAVTTKMELQHKKLYIPSSETFPVVDAFFFVKEPKTIVGIQVAKSKYHPATTSKVMALREYLAALFVDGDSFPTDLSWEIIYVQHTDNKIMTDWQECKMDLLQDQGPEDDVIRGEHEAIAKHWNEEVYQYHLKISS